MFPVKHSMRKNEEVEWTVMSSVRRLFLLHWFDPFIFVYCYFPLRLLLSFFLVFPSSSCQAWASFRLGLRSMTFQGIMCGLDTTFYLTFYPHSFLILCCSRCWNFYFSLCLKLPFSILSSVLHFNHTFCPIIPCILYGDYYLFSYINYEFNFYPLEG